MSSDWGLGKSQGLTTHRRKDGQLQPQSQATITSRNARRHKKRSVAAVEEQQVQDTGGKQIAEEQHGDEQEDVVGTGGTPGTEVSEAGRIEKKSRAKCVEVSEEEAECEDEGSGTVRASPGTRYLLS